MLDIKYIRSHQEAIKQSIKIKSINFNLDDLLEVDKKHIVLLQQLQELQRQKKQNAQKFKQLQTPNQKTQIINDGKLISAQINKCQINLNTQQKLFNTLMLQVPNIPCAESPIGKDDTFNTVIKTQGKPITKSFFKNHVDILNNNNWADFKNIATVSGSRSYCLKNEAVLLEQAIIQWGIQFLLQKKFEILNLPNFGDYKSFVGSGHFPDGVEQVYHLEKDNIYLTGTAEVILNSLNRDKILPVEQMPLLMGGLSPCFRREAGSAGKDVKGLLRVHQFIKLEQYIICENNKEQTHYWHNILLQNAEQILQELQIPYRIVMVSTGDMGIGKYKMHDIECWLPSLNKYVETHSCSSLLDWQARRTNIRYRDKNKEVKYCHTLNNTAIALPRLLAMFLENHQQKDGSIYIPPVLQKYLHTDYLQSRFGKSILV